MKIYDFFFVSIVLTFLLCSCSYFEQEKDSILPGKRESVFINDEKILKKANKKVKISPPEYIGSWTQQHQNNRNHLYHFKSNPSLGDCMYSSTNPIRDSTTINNLAS